MPKKIIVNSKQKLRELIQELGAVSPVDQLFVSSGKIYLLRKVVFEVYGDISINFQGETVIDCDREAFRDLPEEQQEAIYEILERREISEHLTTLTTRVNYLGEGWEQDYKVTSPEVIQ